MALSFAFDGTQDGSYEKMLRKRKIAEALYQQASSGAPRNIGEGLSAIGAAIGGRMAEGKANKLESAGREQANKSFASLFQGAPSEAPSFAAPDAPSDFSNTAPMKIEGKEEFIQTLMPAAIEASKRTGVDPRIIIAQGALESGWGKSAPGNNFFGIKSHGKEGGQTFATHEIVNGKRVNIKDSFRQFDSPEASVAGYADFLLENPRYKPMMAAQGLEAQIAALGQSGYATDPNYANKIFQIASGLPDPSMTAQQASPSVMSYQPQGQSPVQAAMEKQLQGMERPQAQPSAPQQVPAGAVQRADQYFPQPQSMDQVAQQIAAQRQPSPVAQALQQRQAQQPMAQPAPQPMQAPRPGPQGQPWERGEMIDPVTGEYMQGTWNGQRGQGNPIANALMSRLQGRQPQAPQQPQQALLAPQGAQVAQQPQMQPQQAQAAPQQGMSGQPSQQELIQIMGDPYLTDAQRMVAKSMFDRQYNRDPMQEQMSQLELQKRQLEIEQMRNPQQKMTDDMREYEFARQQGYEGNFTDFMTQQKKAGAASTTINMGEGDKFYEELDKGNAKMFGELQNEGMAAQRTMVQIDQLEKLLANAPTGAGANLQQIAGNFGINTEGLSEIQAAQALINLLVPQQRPAGSGPMSDADLEMFKQSLPRIINQPGGNAMILQTMRGIAQYTMQQGQIATAVANRELTPAEGRKRLMELENPLANFGAPQQPQTPQAQPQGQIPQSGMVEDGFRFKGGDPANPNNWERVQ